MYKLRVRLFFGEFWKPFFENFVKIQPQHFAQKNKREKEEKNFFGASKKYAQKEEKKKKEREKRNTHTSHKQI